MTHYPSSKNYPTVVWHGLSRVFGSALHYSRQSTATVMVVECLVNWPQTLHWVATSSWTAANIGNVCSFNVQHHVVDSGIILIACRYVGWLMEQAGHMTTLSYVTNMQRICQQTTAALTNILGSRFLNFPPLRLWTCSLGAQSNIITMHQQSSQSSDYYSWINTWY